jgi:ribose transport system substrate-binding protein
MFKSRKFISIATAVILAATTLTMTACNSTTKTTSSTASKSTIPYIAVVAKGFQSQYWQVVMQGAEKAATDYKVKITFDGPAAESDISDQVNMLNADIAKHPVAICLAALDTTSVSSQLAQCQQDKIPVIGFDSGVPNAPAGQIAATAATDNEKAAAIAADHMFADTTLLAEIKAATVAKPVVIGVLSQDATSASIIGRTKGFIDEMKTQIETISGFSGCVEVSGQATFNSSATNGAKVKIVVNVPPTTNATDLQNGAQALLGNKSLIALYASNQTTADAVDAATSDGSLLATTYKGLVVVGFDAGAGQKASVKNGLFLGSITQDPYTIGYDAVKLAYEAYKGQPVADIDTGAKWYDKTNMTESDIANLLYN